MYDPFEKMTDEMKADRAERALELGRRLGVVSRDGSGPTGEAKASEIPRATIDVLIRLDELQEAGSISLGEIASPCPESLPESDSAGISVLSRSRSSEMATWVDAPEEGGGEGGHERSSLSAGSRLYTDLQVFDAGGMGQIFRATDSELGRQVAIKMLHSSRSSDRKAIHRFQREVRVTARLEHPNIVPVHDAGVTAEGVHFFCMKLVGGQSLSKLLSGLRGDANANNIPHDGTRLLGDFLKVCDAIHFAHSRGIVHRDLKPANIMIGSFGEVLVMDWGLARMEGVFGEGEEEDREEGALPIEDLERELDSMRSADIGRTLEGTVLGTLVYMPPEQAEGKMREIDSQSDLYSLGAILYEILTLHVPFSDRKAHTILAKVLHGEFPSPRERNPNAFIAHDLESVVLKAMALKKIDRYRSVEEMKADIQAFLDGRTLQAATYNPIQRLFKWVARNRKMCTGAAAVFLLSVGFFGILHRQQRLERERKWEQERRAQKERFEFHRDEGIRLLREAGNITGLVASRPFVDPKTGVERKDTPAERRRRNGAIQGYIAASEFLDRSLEIFPGDSGVTQKRLEAGLAIGRMALQGRDYLLARQAFLQLQGHGITEEKIEELVREVETAENSIQSLRKERLEAILLDLTRGLAYEGRPKAAPLLPDYVFEAVSYRDLQTVEILVEDLEKLTEKARGQSIAWTQSERDRATFICRVLGRIGLPECVKPLGEWLGVVTDHQLAVEAGQALCNTRNPEAQAYLVTAQDHFGINSSTWSQIREFFARIPEAESAKTSLTAIEMIGQGQIYEQKEAYERAFTSYSRAIELDPESAMAYTNRGRILAARGDLGGATDDFRRAIELDPEDAIPYIALGHVRQRRGDMDGAIADFTRAIERDPRLVNAYRARGAARKMKGDLEGAFADYDQAIEMDPLDAYAFNDRGAVRETMKDLEGAIADYDRAIEIDPGSIVSYNNRGNARLMKGDLNGAIEDYTQAIERDPRSATSYSNRGNARQKNGDLDGAIADYDQAIEIDPENADAFNGRGVAWQAKGRFGEAIDDYTQAIELNPRSSSYYKNRGVVRTEKGDPDGAIEDYNRAIEIEPRLASAYYNRAVAWESKGDLDSAVANYEKAIEIDADYAEAYFGRGNSRQKNGDFEGAIADYGRAIMLDPKNAVAYCNRGNIWQGRGDLNGAIADYDRAIRIDPRYAVAYSNRGNARQAKGDFKGASEDYRRAIRLEPGFAPAYHNRSIARRARGDFRGAIEDCSKVIELDPRFSKAYVERGHARQDAGDFGGAIEDYSRAIEINPRSVDAYGSRGSLRVAQGNFPAGIADFEKALEIAPANWSYRKLVEVHLAKARKKLAGQ